MQRRTIKREPPGRDPSFAQPSPKNQYESDKVKGRSLCSLKTLLFAVVIVFGTGALLVPKKELIRAEHLVEEELIRAEHQVEARVEEWMHHQPQPPQDETETLPKERLRSTPKQSEKKEEEKPEPRFSRRAVLEPPSLRREEPEPEQVPEKKNDASVSAAKARTEGHSTRWVDGEKAFKKKMQVLFDMQKKGNSLGVPVLTRYLGEDVPAFVGTPDSAMSEEEFKKLVDIKYEEMRKEEEEWQKKMALLIEEKKNKGRDMGITTP